MLRFIRVLCGGLVALWASIGTVSGDAVDANGTPLAALIECAAGCVLEYGQVYEARLGIDALYLDEVVYLPKPLYDWLDRVYILSLPEGVGPPAQPLPFDLAALDIRDLAAREDSAAHRLSVVRGIVAWLYLVAISWRRLCSWWWWRWNRW